MTAKIERARMKARATSSVPHQCGNAAVSWESPATIGKTAEITNSAALAMLSAFIGLRSKDARSSA